MIVASNTQMPDFQTPSKTTLRAICQHVIAMIGSYCQLDERGGTIGQPLPYSYTGCILENNGHWFIATSGHVLTDMNAKMGNPQIRIESQYLADNFGANAHHKELIPFKPLEQQKMALDRSGDFGLDLGLIYLRPFYKNLLEQNGIVPFTPKQWCFPKDIQFESFGVVGFPDEYTLPEATGTAYRSSILRPAYVPLLEIEDDQSTTVHRFRAEIADKGNQESIVGMSGGPIVGFYSDNGETKYLLHAIQSSWNEKDIIYGCYLRDTMQILQKAAIAEHESVGDL